MRVICILPETGHQPSGDQTGAQTTDQKRISAFVESAYRLTPDITVRKSENKVDITAIFLDIGRCKLLYSEKTVLARVQFLLKRFGLKARVALANDLSLALSSAVTGETLVKKLPLTVLSFYADPLALDPSTPAAVLKIEKELDRLGIRMVSDLMNLPLRSVSHRFGGVAEKCWRRLHSPGLLQTIPWPKWRPPELIEERVSLYENEICLAVEPLLFSCRTPLDRVMARVQGRGLRITGLSLVLECEKRSSVSKAERKFEFKFLYPQGTLNGVLPVIRERITRELQTHPLESPVVGLRAQVLEMASGRHGQKNFFHATEEAREELLGLLERLTGKLGKEKVFYAQTTERYFPEQSWTKTRMPSETFPQVSLPYGERPLRLLNSPLPLHRVGRNLMSGDRRWSIRKLHGPEKIQGEWWNEEHPRNYYRIETEESVDLWIFRGGFRERELYLHGFFGDEVGL